MTQHVINIRIVITCKESVTEHLLALLKRACAKLPQYFGVTVYSVDLVSKEGVQL